ncbi:hypothetical protein [Parvibium lacunae]|uniref:Uncharacterized protein n=1 Tax=Parvibium lacunae TaxID=1888893 RepID=A0A368L4C3_9BURK|nr:hypothetical protein [Parvibium lacunae]RCS58282.1 hypothetical protein DU000_05510 [Parvibium lacunae]
MSISNPHPLSVSDKGAGLMPWGYYCFCLNYALLGIFLYAIGGLLFEAEYWFSYLWANALLICWVIDQRKFIRACFTEPERFFLSEVTLAKRVVRYAVIATVINVAGGIQYLCGGDLPLIPHQEIYSCLAGKDLTPNWFCQHFSLEMPFLDLPAPAEPATELQSK